MVSVGGDANVETGAPLVTSCALRSYTGDSVWKPDGAVVVDVVTDTCVSDVTLDGPKDTVAEESALEIVPPSVGETTCGGERPLPVLAFGSGGVPSVPLGVFEV